MVSQGSDSQEDRPSQAVPGRPATIYRIALAIASLTMIVLVAFVIVAARTTGLVAVGLLCLALAVLGAILLARSLIEPGGEVALAADHGEQSPGEERRQLQLDAELQRDVIAQASTLERSRELERSLPPATVRALTEGDGPLRQRAQLTVFRLELRGFAAKVESAEPEDLAAMLNGYLSEMVEVAFSHGATVDKIICDTVVGYFGAPETEGPEHDALRCARLALELWHRATAVCERWHGLLEGEPPVPTLVLASGLATVGNFGSANRMEYTAVGGSVDDAAALIASVAPGEVVCSQSTFSAIERELPGTLCGEVTQRRSRRIKLYRLAGPPEALSRRRAAVTGAVPTAPMLEAMADTQPRARPRITPSGDLEVGIVLGDRYKVIRPLGEGGMGTVYLTHDVKLGTNVALKLLRQDHQGGQRRTSRLLHEVKLARLVSHPNVARIYDIDEAEGFDFISMEYVSGEPLDGRLSAEGQLSVKQGLDVVRQLCAGLGAAHAAGIVHGDLKPANIMLEEGGRVVILDFGIARWASAIKQNRAESQALGTPFYMAPEQFKGNDGDHRADIYALGVLAFEVFTGRRTLCGDKLVSIAYQHANEQPEPPQQLNPEIPPRLAAVILTCLAKTPHDRFGSVGEIATCLAEFHVADSGMVHRLVAPTSS